MKPALVSDIACATIVMVSNITTITAIVQTIFDPEYHLSQNILPFSLLALAAWPMIKAR